MTASPAQTARPEKREIARFFGAAGDGDVRAVADFLRRYPGAVNITGGGVVNGWTALAHAAVFNHKNVVRLLIENGADVNLADPDGYTPLMHAAARDKNIDIVEMLLKANADVNAQNTDGVTALMRAAEGKSWEPVLMLLEAKSDCCLTTQLGWTAADLAKRYAPGIYELMQQWQEDQKEKAALTEDIADFSPKLKRSMPVPQKMRPKP